MSDEIKTTIDASSVEPVRSPITGGERIMAALIGAVVWAIIGGLALFLFAYARDASWFPADWRDIQAAGWFGVRAGALVGLLIGLIGGVARIIATFVQTFAGILYGAILGMVALSCLSLLLTVFGLREGYVNALLNGVIVGGLYGGSIGAIFVAMAGVVGGTIAGMILGVTLSILGADPKGVLESIRDGVQDLWGGQAEAN